MIKNLFKNVLYRTSLDFVHPIGEIFISSDADFNPNTKWGGTWELLEDSFLVGAGNTYTLGDTGGEAEHTLTVDEAPSHRHPYEVKNVSGATIQNVMYKAGSAVTSPQYMCVSQGAAASSGGYFDMQYIGGDQPHNNLPPYTAVNMWLRTA